MDTKHYFDPEDSEWDGLQLQAASLRRWLVTRLRGQIQFADSTDSALREAAIEALCDHASELLTWHADDRYRGDDYANGGWQLNVPALNQLFPVVMESVRREADAARFATLDAYLVALHAGEIEAPAPREPAAVSLVADPKAFRAALATRPVPCKLCGSRFVRKNRNQRTCSDCRAPRRELRTMHAAEDAAALKAGAKYLRALLKDRTIDPFAFPSGQPYDYLSHDAVREWLAGTNRPKGMTCRLIGELHWKLDEAEQRMMAYAFRRRSLWHPSVQDELAARFRKYRIVSGGKDGK